TRPHVVADGHLRGVGADQPGKRGADLKNELLVNFLAHEPTHVVCLDDVLYRRSGPGHSAPWWQGVTVEASLAVAPHLHRAPVAPELHSTRKIPREAHAECSSGENGAVSRRDRAARAGARDGGRSCRGAGPGGAVRTPPCGPR